MFQKERPGKTDNCLIFSVFMVATPKLHQHLFGSLQYPLLRVLGWLTPEDLLTVLFLPRQIPSILWEEIRFLYCTQGSGWVRQCGYFILWEKARPFVEFSSLKDLGVLGR